MDSVVPNSLSYDNKRPHAVCIPYPAQGHINPMFKLANFLHFKGFHVTFVHTEYNYRRLLESRDSSSTSSPFVLSSQNFQFETIPDGLLNSENSDSTQDIPSLCDSTSKNCLEPLINLISKLNNDTKVPPVTSIVSDGSMSFALDAAEKFGLPCVFIWTPSACGVLAYTQFQELIKRGLFPLKDESCLSNGYLETTIDWIPAMKIIRLKDFPSFIRTTNPNDVMVNYIIREIKRTHKASALVLNTFDALEKDVLDALSSMFPNLYTIGPLQLLLEKIVMTRNSRYDPLISGSSSLWTEDANCLKWLDSQELKSVVYVNFGSITTMTSQQLIEFAWGLADSQKSFLWIIRPDLVVGDAAILPREFVVETCNRGKLAGWCAQEQVLSHPAIGGFLTHCGWNSTLESICSGIPILCWPFFAEQQLNCLYSTREWGIGLEISNNVERGEVEKMLRELMDGKKGIEVKKKTMKWKNMAEEAIEPGGSSYENLEKLLSKVLLFMPIVREKPTVELVKVTDEMMSFNAYANLRLEHMNERHIGARMKKATEAEKEDK